MTDHPEVSKYNSDKIKELEQENIILKETNNILDEKTTELTSSLKEFEKKITEETRKEKEILQEKLVMEDIVHVHEETVQKTHKKFYMLMGLISVIISTGFVGYTYYENQIITNTALHLQPNYNSNYVIQNLQGDTVNTWVSWNVANGRIIHVHVVNQANLPQSMIDAMKNAITSTKAVSIDDSQTGKGVKGTSSIYFVGWQGAASEAYSTPTKLYIPQQFDFNGSPDGVGDIEIILTNDVNPDGYSGYTKSLVDGNEILKSKITIYKANKLDVESLEAIIRHEFGHAMGLGHSTAKEDLMSPILPDYPYISSCDVDALKGLYDGDKNSKVVCSK